MKPALVDVSVLVVFFNRPTMLAQVFAQIQKARPARLFLYQDGARNEQDIPLIEACREIVSHIDWECEVHRLYQERNFGCDPSGYLAHTWAFSLTDKCIVLEDDCVPALSFFQFCKEMLDKYENDPRVWMISGFNYDEISDVPYDYFFTSAFTISGWASWRRVIDHWDEHYSFLDDPFNRKQLAEVIKDRKYRSTFIETCEFHRKQNKAFFETIFWSSMMLNSALAIKPTRNMICNIGTSADSTHFAGSEKILPRPLRRIFTMKQLETEFPLKHPHYVIEYLPHKKNTYRILGWGHPYRKIARSFEELYLNVRYGNFKNIGRSIKYRIRKWLKKEI